MSARLLLMKLHLGSCNINSLCLWIQLKMYTEMHRHTWVFFSSIIFGEFVLSVSTFFPYFFCSSFCSSFSSLPIDLWMMKRRLWQQMDTTWSEVRHEHHAVPIVFLNPLPSLPFVPLCSQKLSNSRTRVCAFTNNSMYDSLFR